MTQSGHRDEPQSPAARPAHEGIVLPADGGPPVMPGAQAPVPGEQSGPAGGQPWGQPWGPGAPEPGPEAQPPQYQQGQGQGQYGGGSGSVGGGYGYPQQAQQPHPYQDPQQQPYQQAPPQQSYGAHQGGSYGAGAQPLPAEAPPSGGSADATQFLPPVPAAGAADATQYIPPVPQYQQGHHAGGLPPEQSAEPPMYPGTAHQPPYQQGTSDADATQFIAPVPAAGPHDIPPPGGAYGGMPGGPGAANASGERQPPAEFDNLFRTEGQGGAQLPGETQQLPQIDPGAAPGGPVRGRGRGSAQGGGQPPYTRARGAQEPSGPGGGRAAGRRKSSPLPLIAAVVVGCAVLGLGAGWLMSGDDSEKENTNQTVSSDASPSAPGDDGAADDPAKPQAEELDKLLAESNDSRAAVISAVESIKTCQNLDKAVSDLQGAAQQRRDLVTRLEGLTIDQLPRHGQLSSSLTTAWQASASADDHYATWAAEAKSKKGCRGGKARTTQSAAEGNRASGEATAAKQKASGLWNGIATKYGLTERAPTEL
ncbi:hypothetical protein OG875_17770 [Streptomyces sp. NBC_01498]|uniref:hypothetical protein n=1 Tax=Streptomyces sp. NBC_01498 TaxID=2975870 RepID=UPI002E7BB58A|nr:hypothetical protein [Streptomyces sp. NBC_01498]WTL26269.1 hypothetical protein OG875_17770 [Streptomyces sp. NBC_01498]